MKVDSIIAIGPSMNFYPLTPPSHPKFMLSFMNENLLQHTVRYLAPFSNKIFIFCIDEYKGMVEELIKDFTSPIEIVATEGYDGLGFVLCMVRGKTTAPAVILCKADMYFVNSLEHMLDKFEELEDDMHGYIYKTGETVPIMVLDEFGRLYVYDRERIPYGSIKVLLTNEYRLKNFYIIKTALLDRLTVMDFGFKRCALQKLMKNMAKFRVFRDDNFLVRNIDDYEKQLILKAAFIEGSPDCLLGKGVEIAKGSEVHDSILGDNCRIGERCRLTRCIFMGGVTVGPGCILIDCIIGGNSTVGSGSSLINTKVANDYDLSPHSIHENERLSLVE